MPAVKSYTIKDFGVIAKVGGVDYTVLGEGILNDPKVLGEKESTFRESVSKLAAGAPSL